MDENNRYQINDEEYIENQDNKSRASKLSVILILGFFLTQVYILNEYYKSENLKQELEKAELNQEITNNYNSEVGKISSKEIIIEETDIDNIESPVEEVVIQEEEAIIQENQDENINPTDISTEGVLKEATKQVFGVNEMVGEYSSDKDNILYFINSMDILDGKPTNIEPLYNTSEFENRMAQVSYNQFKQVLSNLKYSESTEQSPMYVEQTLEANCSAATLYIYEWLKVNINPNDHEYHMKIQSDLSETRSEYDGHMYLLLKKSGEDPIKVDISTLQVDKKPFSNLFKFIESI